MDEPSGPQRAEPRLSLHEQDFAIKTWRYLRLAMVVLVVGLAVSLVYEWIRVDMNCLQTSISAYYYTAVHSYFIAALVAIGVCLFCLKGSTATEDVALNLAGILAPVVGLVPTSGPGSCGVVEGLTQHIHDNVANNMTALLVVGFIALAILAALSSRTLPSLPARLGYAVAGAMWLGAGLVFILANHFFLRNVHNVAATLMFVCIFIVVCINACEYRDKEAGTSLRNRYGAIAIAMGASFVVFPIAGVVGWHHWRLGIEFVLTTLFAVFWLIQTEELWDQGLR